DVARYDGHHRQILKSKNGIDGDHTHQPGDRPRAAYVVDTLFQLLERRHQMLHGSPPWQPDLGETGEHREIAQRIDSEAPCQTELREHDRGDRWADDSREVEPAGVEGDGIDEILTRHELDDHCLARRYLERRDESAGRGHGEQPREI